MLCRVLQALAEVDSDEGRVDDANAKYLEAGPYVRILRDTFQNLSLNEQELIANLLYDEACAHGVASDADKALTSLTEAVDAGFTEAEHMAGDEDLALLHDRPEFKALLERATQSAAERERQQVELLRVAEEQALEEIKQEFAKGETIPFDFTLANLDDEAVSLADYEGKVLIVDFWATWCLPCRAEIPHFVELKKRYAEQGFDIVGINYENEEVDEAKQTIADFISENDVNYTCVIGDEETKEQIPDMKGYPTTLFIDRAGKVRLRIVGLRPYPALEWVIKELLSEKSEAGDANEDPAADDADAS
jgi:thiol-disulfide isomerase/thioredoxin